MTARFLTPLIIEDRGGLPFVLHDPLVFYSARFACAIEVPARFTTDFASIPRPLWAVLPPVGKYDAAAVLHDQAYQTGLINGRLITRGDADVLMLEAMTVLGVRWTQRRAIYAGIRAGGWLVWSRYRAASKAPAVAQPEGPGR